jgi:oligo-1,6-glucosidase
MYFLQCGTPFIYQGQEIGMGNIRLKKVEDHKDVLTFNNYRLFSKTLHMSDEKFLDLSAKVNRENARTPVQWDDTENAGFTTGTPWFSVNENYHEINVAAQENDPDSLLNFYRQLTAYRKDNELVIYGKYKEYYRNSSDLYVYERRWKGEKLLVVCSFKEKPLHFKAPEQYDLSKGEIVLSNYKELSHKGNGFVTKPYEVRVYYFGKG